MEVKKATTMLEDAMHDEYFASKCMDWYANDVVFILSRTELEDLHNALNEWVADHNVDKINSVAMMKQDIEYFLEDEEDENVEV